MKGLTVFETEAVLELLNQLKTMNVRIEEMYSELKDLKNTYLTTEDVMAFTKFGKKWVQDNKDRIGYTMIGGHCRFKRKDVIEFMESGYYKGKRQ